MYTSLIDANRVNGKSRVGLHLFLPTTNTASHLNHDFSILIFLYYNYPAMQNGHCYRRGHGPPR